MDEEAVIVLVALLGVLGLCISSMELEPHEKTKFGIQAGGHRQHELVRHVPHAGAPPRTAHF